MARDISHEVRIEIARRTDHRCEYCWIHEDDAGFPHQVDHIVGRKHGGLSILNNLASACILCNRHKGSDIASIASRTGEIVPLFLRGVIDGPTISASRGERINSISEIGSVTVRLLRLNATE